MPQATSAQATTSLPFAHRNFRLFWTARLAVMLAMSCLVLTIGWQIYDIARQTLGIRGSSLRLGLIGLLQFIPILLCTPIAGVVVDTFERRGVLRAAIGLQATGAALLLGLALGQLATLLPIYAIAVLLGAARAFMVPAMNALAPAMVPREILPRAIALNAMAGRIGAILGPMVGGLAYAIAPAAAFSVSLVFLLCAIGCISLIAIPGGSHSRATGHPLQLIAEGLAFVRSNRLLAGTITLDLFAVLLGGSVALLPVYARDVLHVGPQGLGLLRAAPACGALAIAIWYAWRPASGHMGRQMLAGVAIFGLATVAFGLAKSLPLALLALAVSGAADLVSVVTRQSLIQLHTPDDMRGRVGAISAIAISTTNELGEAESGLAAALLGPVAAVVTGGLGAMAITGLWLKLFPELHRMAVPALEARKLSS